jgi:hypothetical protein
MSAEIVKFPYSASRRVYSKKPRQSKNGTPEERAAKAVASEGPPADVVDMSDIRDSGVDRRQLRGSPLREYISAVSFGATIVGKMYTAGLRGEPLAAIEPEVRAEWLEALSLAIAAVETVGMGLIEARHTLKALSEVSDFPVNLAVPDLGQSVLNLAAEQDR